MALQLASRADIFGLILDTVNAIENKFLSSHYARNLDVSQPTRVVNRLIRKFKNSGFSFTDAEQRILNRSFNIIYLRCPENRPQLS
jgi:hypothetical protein